MSKVDVLVSVLFIALLCTLAFFSGYNKGIEDTQEQAALEGAGYWAVGSDGSPEFHFQSK